MTSTPYRERLVKLLSEFANALRQARLPREICTGVERLIDQVDTPCVVAVVGRAKAGKSTFVNTLLGVDAAKVGVTETTAVLSLFSYGRPSNPNRPVRCFYRDGNAEDVDRNFVDSLQGHDPGTLLRAKHIDHLRYYLEIPTLRDVTLVDTPGTEAAVIEHGERTREFLELRNLHVKQTQEYAETADAVIYLVGPVARQTDEQLLNEFTQATQRRSRAFNAVGVLAKVDLDEELLARRAQLAQKLADHLKDSLNCVVPISSELERLACRLEKEPLRLRQLSQSLQLIPRESLQKLLSSPEIWDEANISQCQLPPGERRRLRSEVLWNDTPWSVFRLLVKLAVDSSLDEPTVIKRLHEWSGFSPLRKLLDDHLFKRSRLLRCFRILRDVKKIFSEIRYSKLLEARKQDQQEKDKLDRYLDFLRKAERLDLVTSRELQGLISAVLSCDRAEKLGRLLQTWQERFDELDNELKSHNEDFDALRRLEDNQALFSAAEREELRRLFGLYGLDLEARLGGNANCHQDYIALRQEYWRVEMLGAHAPARRELADLAHTRYATLLAKLLGQV